MKCPMCDGTGKCYEQKIRYQEIETSRTEMYLAKCKKCHGTGEVQMTNEDWFCGLSTEEKAEFLNLIIRVGPYENEPKDFWECVYGRGGDRGTQSIAEWLKQPHTLGDQMQYEYKFHIKMKWSYRRKVFHLRGIFAPNREVAEMKLKDYVENYIDGGKVMDRYDYDILHCEVIAL